MLTKMCNFQSDNIARNFLAAAATDWGNSRSLWLIFERNISPRSLTQRQRPAGESRELVYIAAPDDDPDPNTRRANHL
jgi:hypothetical protein